MLGSITSRCSGNEPALLPQRGGQTRHERAAEIEPTNMLTHAQHFILFLVLRVLLLNLPFVKGFLTCLDILQLKSFSKSLRYSPLSTDHHVVKGLVPKVISHGGSRTRLPASFNIKGLSIQNNEAS